MPTVRIHLILTGFILSSATFVLTMMLHKYSHQRGRHWKICVWTTISSLMATTAQDRWHWAFLRWNGKFLDWQGILSWFQHSNIEIPWKDATQFMVEYCIAHLTKVKWAAGNVGEQQTIVFVCNEIIRHKNLSHVHNASLIIFSQYVQVIYKNWNITSNGLTSSNMTQCIQSLTLNVLSKLLPMSLKWWNLQKSLTCTLQLTLWRK